MDLGQLCLQFRPIVRPYRLLGLASLVLTLICSFTAQGHALTSQ